MANSSANDSPRRTRLISPWAIPVVAGVAVVLLLLTYRQEDFFAPADGGKVDAVSISYTELLLRTRPQDDALRLKLIDQLLQVGDLPRAGFHLGRLYAPNEPRALFLAAELGLRNAIADPDGMGQERKQRLTRELARVDLAGLDAPLLQRYAQDALSLEAPQLAAPAYERLAALQPEQRPRWLEEAARWYVAAGESQRAGELYLSLADSAREPLERRELLRRASDSLLAGGKPEVAAELLAAHLDELGDDAESLAWLKSGVEAARGSQRYDLAEAFIQRWRQLHPGDRDAVLADFQMRLAAGDIHKAWAIGQELLGQDDLDNSLLTQLAQLGEWTGNTGAALDLWARLLQQDEDGKVRDHAWRLSLASFDFDRAIALLQPLTAQRQMSDQELDSLVYAEETRGTPEHAVVVLKDYTKRYPRHRLAWQRYYQVLDHTQDLAAEDRVLQAYSRRFPLSVAERMHWAETRWNLFDATGAWAVLTAVDDSGIEDPDYWRLRSALAWYRESDADTRAAYERMLALGIGLDRSDTQQLVSLYRRSEPRKALQLLLADWRQRHDPRTLADILQLSEDLQDWDTYRSVVLEAEKLPQAQGLADLWLARARLAEQDGQAERAEALYRQALARFPESIAARERLLWFYIDNGKRAELQPLLPQWKELARQNSVLWLPYATANLMLGRTREALGWFALSLKASPDNLLVQAAYADALDAAGYQDAALRLRKSVLPALQQQGMNATPEQFATYLRLLSVSQGPLLADRQARRAWGGQKPLLQVWFEQFLDQLGEGGRESLKDPWLAWGRARGLKISAAEQLQEALRQQNRAALERLLVSAQLDPAQRVEALQRLGYPAIALGESLSQAGDDQVAQIQQQLLMQSVALTEASPQGLQLGWSKRDFGGLDLRGPILEVARNLGDLWYADLKLGQARYNGRDIDDSRLGAERNAQLSLRRQLSDGSLDLTLDSSWRDDDDRHGLGLARSWQLDSRTELQAGLDWRRETDESGLLRALGMRDSLWLGGRHALSGRDELSWRAALNRYRSRAEDDLGHGEAISLEWTHALFLDDPAWLLRTGVDYQHNRLDALPQDLLASRGGALLNEDAITDDLLQDRYGQVYVGSTWRRGFPGALNRTRPQFTWMLDTLAGWQWTEKDFNYGINLGVGMELLGDDELALSIGYQSAPQGGGGDAGGNVALTYSTRFGR